MAMSKMALGIDLGTTNSCVAVVRNSRVEIIHNDMGGRTTPSCVAFDDGEVYVGHAAKEQAIGNFSNTVSENKRLMGCKFTDTSVQSDIKRWLFEVIDDNSSPVVRVQCKNKPLLYAPEQISAMVLEKMKSAATDFLGHEVRDAVITVPAYFNNSQRQATIDAGKIAGLNVLKIINEPTAAALAYGYEKKVVVDQTILVYDLGGGTFDVSILNVADKDYVVQAVTGDTHLGGADFDERLTEHFVCEIKKKYRKDISQNNKNLARLKKACETAKIFLSTPTKSKTKVCVDSLLDGEDFTEDLTRSKFDHLCIDLFQKTIKHVKTAIEEAGLHKSDINEVILVGGSTRIIKIQELLSDFFDGKKLNKTINPDEAVAYGAAIQAALLSREHTMKQLTLSDVVPLSLGQSDYKGNMNVFIKKNTLYPVTVVQDTWTTSVDYQEKASVYIYEGERKLAKDNHYLGTYLYEVGERELKGVPELTYTFSLDANCVLDVSGENVKTQTKGGMTITSHQGRLTKEKIERMIKEAEQMKIK